MNQQSVSKNRDRGRRESRKFTIFSWKMSRVSRMRKLSLKWEDIGCDNQVEIEYQIMPRFEKRGFGISSILAWSSCTSSIDRCDRYESYRESIVWNELLSKGISRTSLAAMCIRANRRIAKLYRQQTHASSAAQDCAECSRKLAAILLTSSL